MACFVFAIEAAGLNAHIFGVTEVHFKALLWESVSDGPGLQVMVALVLCGSHSCVLMFLCPIFYLRSADVASHSAITSFVISRSAGWLCEEFPA